MSGGSDTKECPFCLETIKAGALRCKHCHADLTGRSSTPAGVAESAESRMCACLSSFRMETALPPRRRGIRRSARGVGTGLPIRFPRVEWLGHIYVLFGELAGARIAHRVAAVVMIITWIWHTLYLLYRWRKHGFSFESWSMWPNRKDWADFIAVSKYYLGLSKEEPRYDRFQFREKFDHFAVYWGMPIMVFSGLVLWFPTYFGNRLPEIELSFAYIAHSDEAILAFLAIVLWHFYNTHFNPDNFPMSPTWYTGTKTQEERAREHPLELARLEGQNPGQAAGATVPPPPRPPDAPAGGDPPRGANG